MFLPPWPSQNERLNLQTTRHKGNYSGRTRRVTGRETIPVGFALEESTSTHAQYGVGGWKWRGENIFHEHARHSRVQSCRHLANVSVAGLKSLMLFLPPKSWKTGSLLEFQLGEQMPSGDTAQHRLPRVPVLTHGIDRFNFLLFFPRIIECF